MKLSCPHCGQHYEIEDVDVGKEADCIKCGKRFTLCADQASSTAVHCPYCGGELQPGIKKCRHCGEWLNPLDKPKSPVVYVVLAFFFGMLGIHNFYSGAKGKGCIKLWMLVGALPVASIVSALLSILAKLLAASGTKPRMVGGFGDIFLVVPCIWLVSAIWCIVEMFHCREEIANGVVEISPKLKRILKWVKIILIMWLAVAVIINIYSSIAG